MTVTPAPVVELLLDGTVTEDEERDVIALFTPLGYAGQVRRQPPRRGPDDLAWLVLAALPLQAFLKGLGGDIGTDAYAALKKLVSRLNHRSTPVKAAPLVLADPDSGLRIVLDADLPADAYRQLCDLDLAKYRIGPLHYDQAHGRWRSELDEAAS
ncbi:MAG TPA: hypothetical protein VH352_08655 [Pseudonocardiaceae bacterium]|nr:hypothetical protein [Pseudonocardiaceae bacterium]